MERAAQLLRVLSRLERGVACAAFVVLIAVVFLDVASRELTGTGLHWALQIGVYANLFVVMVGLGVASATGAHLRPRFADGWLPVAWDPVVSRLQELVTALFFGTFSVIGVMVVNETWQLAERASVLGNLIWPLQAVIPVVFALAAVRHSLYAVYPPLRPVTADEISESGHT